MKDIKDNDFLYSDLLNNVNDSDEFIKLVETVNVLERYYNNQKALEAIL